MDSLTSIHKQVSANLQVAYDKYKSFADRHKREVSFQIGDQVWVYLSKDRYPQGEYNKLKPKKLGPCTILDKFGDNAYRVELPDGWQIHDTFNVKHLQPYFGEFEASNSRSSSFSDGRTDAEHLHDLNSSSSLDINQIEEDYYKKYGMVYEQKKKRNKERKDGVEE